MLMRPSDSVLAFVEYRKTRCEEAMAVDAIYGETGAGKHCGPLASLSASYSSMLAASGYPDVISVYEHPSYRDLVLNNNNNNSERDYATTLQIRRTVPPLAAFCAAEMWMCPVHGRVLSPRVWRGGERVYDVAARLDTVHEDVQHTDDDLEASAPAGAAAETDSVEVLSPFYHELEPTTLDSTTCRH